ncbi:pentapeptide repeat-containing protein [Parasphingorhabdus sp.]|uniref:pentapeptide repeat-containing protein n=1 Tax=Parasphingorhabdus sp. TaxID=2709688 RepID=UPI003A913447
MRLNGLKLILSLLAAPFLISPAHATPPPPGCADLILAGDGAEKDISDQSGARLMRIDGDSLPDPAALKAAINREELDAAIIVGGKFSGWDFSGFSLRQACFVDSDLSRSNWSNATLVVPTFVRTNLEGANFQNADIAHANLQNSNLKNVNARGADISWGRLGGGWFEGSVEGWDVDGANMTGFRFECGITLSDGCPVYQGGDGISARWTDFSRAVLHSFGLYDADVAGAILDQTIIGPGQLPDLEKAQFRGPVILRGGDHDVGVSADEARTLLAVHAEQQAAQARPSFDCSKASSKVEQEICGEYASDLRVADRDVATLYQRAKAVDSGVRASQRVWLQQRNRCASAEFPSDCIRQSYSLRKGELLGLIGETDWLAPGESALFVDDVLPLPAAFRQSKLFVRIVPVLAGASMTEILVERADDGLYAIKGSAVGANAHLCSLSASHLYLDRETGWYIPVSEGPAMPIFRIIDGRLEIFAGGKPDYEKYPDASDFMGCGMRASFGETVRIDADKGMIERYRKSLTEEM